MAEPSNEHLRSLLAAFDDALSAIEQLTRLSSTSNADVAQFGASQSPRVLVGRLLQAIPAFEQARSALGAERDRARGRLEEAEGTLAVVTAAPRPLPGSREEYAMGASVRQAERDAEQAQIDVRLLETRLGASIDWDSVRTGLGRVSNVALPRYAAYLRDAHLADAPAALQHSARRVLEARATYLKTVEELTELAAGHASAQPDLIAPEVTAALEVLLQANAWTPPVPVPEAADSSTRGPRGLLSRVLSGAARS